MELEVTMCNCWLGTLNDYNQSDENNLYMNNIKRRLNEQSKHSFEMAKLSNQWKSFEPKEYVDRRRGLATIFKFCPDCGKKINWKEIRKALS